MNTIVTPLCAQVTREQLQKWEERSPTDRLAHQHYWRAKRLNGGNPNGFWPGVWWEQLCERAGWRCTYCGRPTHDLSPDHVRALAAGGSNEWRNIVPACRECQLKKGSRSFTVLLPIPDFLDVYFRLHPEQLEVWRALGEEGDEADASESGRTKAG